MSVIHALPGLGADRRMFPAPWERIENFVSHDWPAYKGEKSLSDVAFAVARAWNIQDGHSLIGASLGGMIACEITNIRRIEKLFLVSSALSTAEINRSLGLLHPLAQVAPFGIIQSASVRIPSLLLRMFASVDKRLMRAMCKAVFQWDGVKTPRCPIIRIHGARDRIIRPPKNPELLLDGGHFIAMTHAAMCAQFINEKLNR